VSVVIPTIGRSTLLQRTVESVLRSHYPDLELVLVVNGDADLASRIQAAHAEERVVVVREPRRGAARARNTGARHATGSVLFFVDDDVVLTPDTVWHVVEPLFRAPGIGVVTGRIRPASVESDAQRLLEEYGGYDKGPEVLRFGADDFRRGGRLYPFLPGRLGSGAAIAMRRATFESLGGFDERLGPGTPTRGAEDLDLLVRVIKAGRLVEYSPSAVVWHGHRCDLPALGRQLRGYGIGMGALATKEMVSDPLTAARMLARTPAGIRYTLSPRSAKNAGKTDYPWQLTANELLGLLLGPLAFATSAVQSRWRRHGTRPSPWPA
jgi:GT2 family glycosyltransferase